MKEKAIKIFILILLVLPMWITLIYAASPAMDWQSFANQELLKIEEPRVQIAKVLEASEAFDPSFSSDRVKLDLSQIQDRSRSELALSFETTDGRLLKHVRLKIEPIIQKKVAITSRSLKRGEAVTEADIRWEWREARNVAPSTVVGRLPVGAVLRTNVQQGEALDSNRLDAGIAVRRGERVSIRVVGPGILITAKGVAQEPGRIGQSIRILNTDSKKEVFGTVIGNENVEVRI
jgi:flagella basal body P-ring formation protein FlgA